MLCMGKIETRVEEKLQINDLFEYSEIIKKKMFDNSFLRFLGNIEIFCMDERSL